MGSHARQAIIGAQIRAKDSVQNPGHALYREFAGLSSVECIPALGFMLHDNGSGSHLIAVGHVSDLE